VEDPGLCELQPGEADGLLWDDYRERYGNFDLVAEPRRAFAPGGESWTEFLHRVDSTLQRLSRQYDKELVVAVTHAGFIVASLLVLFDIPRPGTGARLEPLHAALTEWSVSDGIWQLVRFNHC
jgi:probable phosphoglycerate mutase